MSQPVLLALFAFKDIRGDAVSFFRVEVAD